MFYDRVFGLDINIDDELREAEENVNPSPMRCVIVKNDAKLYELCINDDKLEITKYIKKVLRNDDDVNDTLNSQPYFTPDTNDDDEEAYKIIDFDEFEQFRYRQAMMLSEWN
eukprot:UN09322